MTTDILIQYTSGLFQLLGYLKISYIIRLFVVNVQKGILWSDSETFFNSGLIVFSSTNSKLNKWCEISVCPVTNQRKETLRAFIRFSRKTALTEKQTAQIASRNETSTTRKRA